MAVKDRGCLEITVLVCFNCSGVIKIITGCASIFFNTCYTEFKINAE